MLHFVSKSVFEAVNRCGDPSSPLYELLAGKSVHAHDRGIAEQSSEDGLIAHALSVNRDDPDGSRLLVDHSDRHLIGNNAGNG